LLAALLLAAGGCATPRQAPLPSDWERKHQERDWREVEVPLPPYPRRANLLPFFVSSASRFEFFIDGASLAPGEDGVVRYVLVARSPQGAETVSFEGIRCSTAEFRIYATGSGDGRWSRGANPWRPIEPRSVQRWHDALRKEYFCPLGNPIRNAAEGIDGLRRGGLPGRSRSVD
jgi:CNP1-like family